MPERAQCRHEILPSVGATRILLRESRENGRRQEGPRPIDGYFAQGAYFNLQHGGDLCRFGRCGSGSRLALQSVRGARLQPGRLWDGPGNREPQIASSLSGPAQKNEAAAAAVVIQGETGPR